MGRRRKTKKPYGTKKGNSVKRKKILPKIVIIMHRSGKRVIFKTTYRYSPPMVIKKPEDSGTSAPKSNSRDSYKIVDVSGCGLAEMGGSDRLEKAPGVRIGVGRER